jgi:hypothetical protein
MAILSGGCECGAVRYEISAEPIMMFNCHCRTCQKVSGGPYVPVVLVPAKAFKITQGSLRYHFTDTVRGERHPHKRGFCPDCGSRLTGGESNKPRPWMAVTASSLDDSSRYHAQFDIFVSHAQPWDLMDQQLLKHPLYPPKDK